MSDVVQRWRVVHRRGPSTRTFNQRAELEAWEAAVAASDLPTLVDSRRRPRLGVSIPLPVGFTAEAERIDIPLAERCRSADVRSALGRHAPPDHAVVDVHDVWVGAPALVASVVAVDYRVELEPSTVPLAAIEAILTAPALARRRTKGDRPVEYDLRPLLIELRPADSGLWMRLRADPTLGVGRPDEVVAAVAEEVGAPLEVRAGVRERLWLADELAAALADELAAAPGQPLSG